MNQYIRAISAVGSILQEYSTDKKIPTFGFGAKLPYINEVSHCFALNGNIFAPEINGIEGVLSYYQKNVCQLAFSGPTNFAEIIRYMGEMASFYTNNGVLYKYFVLMIITDGAISDLNDTIDEIIKCSYLPLSIIIVGVGNNDFSEMDRLDSDFAPLYSPRLNRYMMRDIVQFVPFSRFAQNPQELASKTLAELPNQLVDYMTGKKIQPLKLAPGTVPIHAPLNMPSYYQTRLNNFVSQIAHLAPLDNVNYLNFY